MTNYKIIIAERKELVSVTCDVCKKTYTEANDSMELQAFIHILERCGYGSIFKDGDTIELDMCQHCFKDRLGEFARILPEYEI